MSATDLHKIPYMGQHMDLGRRSSHGELTAAGIRLAEIGGRVNLSRKKRVSQRQQRAILMRWDAWRAAAAGSQHTFATLEGMKVTPKPVSAQTIKNIINGNY